MALAQTRLDTDSAGTVVVSTTRFKVLGDVYETLVFAADRQGRPNMLKELGRGESKTLRDAYRMHRVICGNFDRVQANLKRVQRYQPFLNN